MSCTSQKLRIALCGARGIPDTYSGTEAFFMELAPRLVARGHEVIVYCRKSHFKERPPSYKGVRLIYLPSIETKVLSTPSHTLVCMLDVLFRNVDVILVTNVANAFHCAIPCLFGKSCAINVDGVEWFRDKWGPFGKKYFHLCATMVGKICPKGIITDAYAMRQIYLDEFRTPSACIAYGANIETSEHPEILSHYGLEPFGYYLIASRLVPENNADLIVKAFEQTRSKRSLVIAGGANYHSEFIEGLKWTTDPRVRFLGHVGSVEHVKELHCNAYGYIHGHSVGGTNPALLKALGYGNLIFAFDTPFNREVVEDYGVLFKTSQELAAKIQFFEENPVAAQDCRNRAPQRILESYTWDHITAQYEELFVQLSLAKDPTLIHSSVVKRPLTNEGRVVAL